MFWVYILQCSDNSYYTGQTSDLERRLAEHQTGAINGCYTFSRRPVCLVFSEYFESRSEALARELQLKGWSRKKKQALIAGDWQALVRLSRPSVFD